MEFLHNLRYAEKIIAVLKNLIFTYHGIFNRDLADASESKLFRNSISENDYVSNLKVLRRFVKIKRGSDGSISLIRNNWLFGQTEIWLTFDDGYANNLKAAEIFHDIFDCAPLTVFLTTNLIGKTEQSIWTVNVSLLILKGEFLKSKMVFGETEFVLSNAADRLNCYQAVRKELKKMNAEDRNHHCNLIIAQTAAGEMQRLMFEYPEFKMLGMNELKQMQSLGVRFEPHGHNHELLHSAQPPEIIEREILESKEFIENNLDQKCRFFAYPNGDYCDSAINLLKLHGFAAAFTTRIGTTQNLADNYEIPRLTPNNKTKKFKQQLRGSIA